MSEVFGKDFLKTQLADPDFREGYLAAKDDVIEEWRKVASAMLERAEVLHDQLALIRGIVEGARKISPSPTMTVYVADLERALGRFDGPAPHKKGQHDAT